MTTTQLYTFNVKGFKQNNNTVTKWHGNYFKRKKDESHMRQTEYKIKVIDKNKNFTLIITEKLKLKNPSFKIF